MHQVINSSNIAKIAFFLYMFFIIFGTNKPFQDIELDLETVATGNPVNQVVFSSIYLLALISIIPKRHQVIAFMKKEKFLSLFVIWILMSVLWSDYTFFSFKRWIHIFGMVSVFLSACLHFNTSEEMFGYFKVLFMLYIPLTLVSVILVPEASMYDPPAWRGLSYHKNNLGQISLIGIIIWAGNLQDREGRIQKYCLLFLMLSTIVLIGSRSFTSILTAIFLFFLSGYLYLEKKVLRRITDRLIIIFLLVVFVTGLVLVIYLSPDLISAFFDFIGKDITFTGRVTIWSYVIEYFKTHLWMGCGFSGFWDLNNEKLEIFVYNYGWIPRHAHMGYLDMLNETGIIGFTLFLLILYQYFQLLIKMDRQNYLKWFVFAALLINCQETTLFQARSLTGVMFALAYIALYVDYMKSVPASSEIPTKNETEEVSKDSDYSKAPP